MTTPDRTRILLVDDEPSIRVTLSAILDQEGYSVTASGTVAEALHEINSKAFDALIADLNIGEPGDGFTVVSAMRRTHPDCVNFILTGYPAFESALQAIRNQVDDYLVKPANVRELVRSLETKLSSPRNSHSITVQPLADFLSENLGEISERTLSVMKSDSSLVTISLSDEQRLDHVPGLLSGIIRQLRSDRPDEATKEVLAEGARHGMVRRRQGYSEDMLVNDIRALDVSIYDTVQNGLLKLDLSRLIPDLRHVNSTLNRHLQESLKAFHGAEKAA